MPLSYPPLHFPTSIPQLVDDFGRVEADAGGLLRDIDDDRFNRPPSPGAWSAAQALDHLTTILQTYVRAMEAGLERGASAAPVPVAVKPGLVSRWFIRQMEPPVKRRFKAPRVVEPRAHVDRDEAWRAFLAAGDLYRSFARRCESVNVNRVRFPNPFAPLRFTLATGLAVMVAHHRRHICQLEAAVTAAGHQSAGPGFTSEPRTCP